MIVTVLYLCHSPYVKNFNQHICCALDFIYCQVTRQTSCASEIAAALGQIWERLKFPTEKECSVRCHYRLQLQCCSSECCSPDDYPLKTHSDTSNQLGPRPIASIAFISLPHTFKSLLCIVAQNNWAINLPFLWLYSYFFYFCIEFVCGLCCL